MQPHVSVTFCRNHQANMTMNFNVSLISLALSVMLVSGLVSFVTMILALVGGWIWNVLGEGLNLMVDWISEAGDLEDGPLEATGCMCSF